MSQQLDNFLVTLGVKGQNVVLSTMDKIRKGKKDISKKTAVDLAAKSAKIKPKDIFEKIGGQAKKSEEADAIKGGSKKDREKKPDKEDASSKKFSKAVDKFGNTTTDFAHSASRLDPAAAIGAGLSALAKMTFAGIPFAIAEAGLNMATNMVSMAKSNAATQYGLTQRNATAGNYGEKISGVKNWSNEEMSALRISIGSTYGKVQQPLADAINNLTKGKNNFDVGALSRVASGNWQSTGTDRGWMLQQLSSAFQGLPPSIAQNFQASLLQNYGAEEIQKTTPAQQTAQWANAEWQNRDEAQTTAIFNKIYSPEKNISGKTNFQNLFELNDKLKNLQVDMVSAGAAVATALNTVANVINTMTTKIRAGK